jgi:hypothetical protein
LLSTLFNPCLSSIIFFFLFFFFFIIIACGKTSVPFRAVSGLPMC